METWRSLFVLCPKDREAHADMAAARLRRAEQLAREGDDRAATGDLPGALGLWRDAQALAPSETVAARLQEVELRQMLEAGMRLYQERRYPEAAFQFRKALALDPDCEEAQRYLGYAQTMRPDSPVTDRFQRLE
jgi:tetratricopeptide (TPR) repeat protein